MLSADRAEAAMARLSMVYDETGRELYMGAGRGCYGPPLPIIWLWLSPPFSARRDANSP